MLQRPTNAEEMLNHFKDHNLRGSLSPLLKSWRHSERKSVQYLVPPVAIDCSVPSGGNTGMGTPQTQSVAGQFAGLAKEIQSNPLLLDVRLRGWGQTHYSAYRRV